MCLIIFKWQPKSETPLILLGNRDEFYQRPTDQAFKWDNDICAGKDKLAGGTWLGITANQRLCTVTNFREVPSSSGEKSRGLIPNEFLLSEVSAQEYATHLAQSSEDYTGFNALIFDGTELVYTSNRDTQNFRILDAGIYGLSNHLLDTPWPKVIKAKGEFKKCIDDSPEANTDQKNALFALMQDQTPAPENELPNTGVGVQSEKLLSSIFIRSKEYGTRTSSLVRIHQKKISLIERSYDTTFNSENSQDLPYTEVEINL